MEKLSKIKLALEIIKVILLFILVIVFIIKF